MGARLCILSFLPFLQAAFHMPRSNVKSVAPAPRALSPGFSLPSCMFPALIQDWIKKEKKKESSTLHMLLLNPPSACNLPCLHLYELQSPGWPFFEVVPAISC